MWLPALVCCVLYAASARLLRDPIFVYVLIAGVTLTGLLILADHQLQHFWEIAGPSTLLVCLGLACIHAERVFPEGEGPFSRRRFGLAFFWSGHAVLGLGLLLLLGAQVCGDWLYLLFEPIYASYDAGQPQIVTTFGGRFLALCLVLAGTYAYAYSDLIVRRMGVYIYIAVFSLLWAEVLALNLLPLNIPMMEVIILSAFHNRLGREPGAGADGRKGFAFAAGGAAVGAVSVCPAGSAGRSAALPGQPSGDLAVALHAGLDLRGGHADGGAVVPGLGVFVPAFASGLVADVFLRHRRCDARRRRRAAGRAGTE